MDAEEALRIIREGEGQTVEFKRTFAEQNDAIRSLCAFANAEGGTVLFGVTDDGVLQDCPCSAKTLRDFPNALKTNTDPRIIPTIDPLTIDGSRIVSVTVRKAHKGQVFSAFGRFYIRIGSTNQPMPVNEVRARLMEGQSSAEERDLPRFEVRLQALRRPEAEFEPKMTVTHMSGDKVANLQWRFRGPRFIMDWRQASGSALDRTTFLASFDLSREPQEREDEMIEVDEMGFELRFHWQGGWRHELHRWPINRRDIPDKVVWDVAEERLPPLYFEEEPTVGVMLV